MGQEFVIKSQALEDKINQLLPSQGGLQAGVDLSASTQIIPIVDLTESAEGSDVRSDLQTALSFNSVSNTSVTNATTTILTTTGYYRVFGTCNITGTGACSLIINDPTPTSKIILRFNGGSSQNYTESFDFVILLTAGDSLLVQSLNTASNCNVSTRQIADLAGNLVNP